METHRIRRRILPGLRACIVVFALCPGYLAYGQTSISLLQAVERFQAAWGVDVSYVTATLDGRTTIWTEPVADDAESDLVLLLTETGVTFARQPGGTYLLVDTPEPDYALLTGTVTMQSTGRPLPGAHIVVNGTPLGATSSDGQFAIPDLPPGPVSVSISHLGFVNEERELTLMAGETSSMHVLLTEAVLEYRSIEVIASPLFDQTPDLAHAGNVRFDTRVTDDLSRIAGMGQADLVQNLRDVSGVVVDLNTSDIHIQGSGRGEHQFLLDGSVVFDPVHLGLFGAFNPFAIGSVVVRKAGFDPTEGSFLAGVISAEHAVEPGAAAFDLQIDPLSMNSRVNSSLRIGPSRIRLMGAFRTSIWDGWWSGMRSENVDRLLTSWGSPDRFLMLASLYPLKRVIPFAYDLFAERLSDVPPAALPDIGFDDVHFVADMDLLGGRRFGMSWFRGSSRIQGRLPIASSIELDGRIVPPARHAWVNENLGLTWESRLTGQSTLTAAVRRSVYNLDHHYGGLDRQNSVTAAFNVVRYDVIPTEDNNRIEQRSVTLALDYEHTLGSIESGLELERANHGFSIRHVFPRVIDHARETNLTSGYVQQVFEPWNWIEWTAGSRFTWLHAQQKLYAEPRTSLRFSSRYRGGSGVSLRLATGIYHQFLNQFELSTISPSTIVSSTRFWLPVDETLPAPRSVHYSADLSAQLWTNWAFRLEHYYKRQDRLYRIDYPRLWRLDRIPGAISTISQFVTLTHGVARGTSVELRREVESLFLSARYEFSLSKREYGFSPGEVKLVSVPWNVPCEVNLQARYRPVDALEGTVRWRGNWGRTWAYRQSYYDLLGTDVSLGQSFDDFRFVDPTAPGHALRPFSQLDLGLATEFQLRGAGRLQLRADVLNVLDRHNEAYYQLREQTVNEDELRRLVSESYYLLRRTLSISAQLHW